MKYHRHAFLCPNCKQPAGLMAVCFTASAAVLFEGICVQCGISLHCESDFATLICECFNLDNTENMITAPALKLGTIEDVDFLKRMHIRLEE